MEPAHFTKNSSYLLNIILVTNKYHVTTSGAWDPFLDQSIRYHCPVFGIFKVRKSAKIVKRYNQVPHLTQDTTWKSNKNTINITNKSQAVHKSMRNTRHKNTNDPQKKYCIGTVSKNILLEGLNQFYCALSLQIPKFNVTNDTFSSTTVVIMIT